VPLLPASLTEPLWVQFSALFNEDDRPEFAATHPWGCHRRPIPNRVVFNHVLAALVQAAVTSASPPRGVRIARSAADCSTGPSAR
jgi:hypothetical protein